MLGWSEAQFWGSTYLYLTSAYVGYCKRKGIGPWKPRAGAPGREPPPLTAPEVEALRDGMRDLQARFPDGKASKELKRRASRATRSARRRDDRTARA